jgi:hypothetical protein
LYVLTLSAAGSVDLITAIGTAAADPISFQALQASGSLSVVTSIPTAQANEVVITTCASLPDVYAITTVPLVDPLLTTAITGQAIALPITTGFVGTDITYLVDAQRTMPGSLVPRQRLYTSQFDLFVVTGESSPPPIDLTKYSALISLTAFDNSGDYFKYMKPLDSTLTLPFLDTNKTIPILDVTGAAEKAVKLLISDTNGQLALLGSPGRLRVNTTARSNLGVCVPGSINVSSGGIGPYYEPDGEIRLLGAIPVYKDLGNAKSCPCFTTEDPDGGPVAPADNSTIIGAPNPCTLRVRRLQLRQCHT